MSAKDAAIALIRALPDDVTPDAIRAELDEHLGDELSEDEWEAAWLAECERRLEDLRSGNDPGVPGDEFMQRMREKYG